VKKKEARSHNVFISSAITTA